MLCSYKLNREIGKLPQREREGRGILKSAYEKNVPVFVPAFTDSEIGLDFALHNRTRARTTFRRCVSIHSKIWSSSPRHC